VLEVLIEIMEACHVRGAVAHDEICLLQRGGGIACETTGLFVFFIHIIIIIINTIIIIIHNRMRCRPLRQECFKRARVALRPTQRILTYHLHDPLEAMLKRRSPSPSFGGGGGE